MEKVKYALLYIIGSIMILGAIILGSIFPSSGVGGIILVSSQIIILIAIIFHVDYEKSQRKINKYRYFYFDDKKQLLIINYMKKKKIPYYAISGFQVIEDDIVIIKGNINKKLEYPSSIERDYNTFVNSLIFEIQVKNDKFDLITFSYITTKNSLTNNISKEAYSEILNISAKLSKVINSSFKYEDFLNIYNFTLVDNEFNDGLKNSLAFISTKKIGEFLEIDDVNKRIKCIISGMNSFINYSDILDYEVLEDDENIIKGASVGKAIAGGMLFGGAGAIVGSNMGKRSKSEIKRLTLVIRTNNIQRPNIMINLIQSSIEKNSSKYVKIINLLQEAISVLNIIINENNSNKVISNTEVNNGNLSVADELRKYKQLLDDGIITLEEFDAIKKKLLNI